ncbi:MAG: DUF6036 family nucleotidyltransferase [Polyangiaceae bacterium]
MTREQLEHVIRAAANIADDNEIVIIGSQSILGQFPDAPAELRVSVEADVFPKNHPERWDLIDGSIGEGSPFHETFGYYAQGVAEDTATLPAGWKDRLVAVSNANTRGATGLCLDVHDLVISKYVAAREKDDHFVREAIRCGLVEEGVLLARLAGTALDDARREQIASRIRHDFGREVARR